MTDREEQIRERAYLIWELEGRPHGQDVRHWIQAAEEIDSAEAAGGGEGATTDAAPASTADEPIADIAEPSKDKRPAAAKPLR